MKTLWSQCQEDFEPDGSLIDIYVFETTRMDWEKLLRFVGNQYNCVYHLLGITSESLPSAEWIFSEKSSIHGPLVIKTGHVEITTNFFMESQIELWLSREEVTSLSDFEELCQFVKGVGNAIEKNVRVTPESGEEIPIFEFDYASRSFRFFENQSRHFLR
jgi:hypothetical protein